MTDVLTVPTHFGDLSELSSGLVDRVGDGSLILYGPTTFQPGEVVSFRVLLADDTTALEGHGRINEVYDGGEAREPETRYDIVFDSLELDGRNEVVYERIVLARESMVGDAPATGEVDISEFEEQDAAALAESIPPEDFDAMEAEQVAFEGDDTQAVDASEFGIDQGFADEQAVAEQGFAEASPEAYAAEQPEEFADFAAEAPAEEFVADEYPAESIEEVAPEPDVMSITPTDGLLGRPTFAASWNPTAPAPEPRDSTGWFLYEAGALPVPAQAPRPELSPEQRIDPAPRPDPNAPEQNQAADAQTYEQPAEEEAYEAESAEPEAYEEQAVAEEDPTATVEAEIEDFAEPGEFEEIPLPDADAEIAPAVEAEYVSVTDAVDPNEASFADVDGPPVDDVPIETGFEDVDPDGGFEDFGDVDIDV